MTERSAHYAREVNAEVREVDEKINHNESHDTIDGHTSYTLGKHATFAEHAYTLLAHLSCIRACNSSA